MQKKLVKSPVNYTGGKYKLLPQLLDIFPDKISMFYDVFGGGANLSLNVNSDFVLYNDIVFYMSNMFRDLKGEDIDVCLNKIKKIIFKFNLNKTNKKGFENLRDYYNKGNKSWEIFLVLIFFSFNNQYRFNNKQEYNSSFGKNKSYYRESTEKRFIDFMERLNNIDISFSSLDFRDIDYSDADENDLVYFDPPYILSCANYNDGKRGFKNWNEQDDIDLMNLCDRLDKQGTRFALSNVFAHKGMTNDKLIEWSRKYKVHHLNCNYNNCNYNLKDKKNNKTIEVLITNF